MRGRPAGPRVGTGVGPEPQTSPRPLRGRRHHRPDAPGRRVGQAPGACGWLPCRWLPLSPAPLVPALAASGHPGPEAPSPRHTAQGCAPGAAREPALVRAHALRPRPRLGGLSPPRGVASAAGPLVLTAPALLGTRSGLALLEDAVQ